MKILKSIIFKILIIKTQENKKNKNLMIILKLKKEKPNHQIAISFWIESIVNLQAFQNFSLKIILKLVLIRLIKHIININAILIKILN